MKNNTYRIKKIENEIKIKISLLIYKKLNDKRIKDVNILNVNISLDLSLAKIFVIFIENKNIFNKIKILNKTSNFFRKKLFKLINVRFIPKLLFIYDSNIEKSRNIINIINNLKLIH